MTVTALTLAPVDPEWVKEAVAAYIKAYVRRRVEAGESKRDIGLSLGFKGGQRINQYVDPKKYGAAGVSVDTQMRVAELLHGGSLDALREAAIAFAGEHPEELSVRSARTTHYDPRYPKRQAAIEQIVEVGEATEEEATEAADAVAVALASDEDLPTLAWVDEIRTELRRRRRGIGRVGARRLTEEDAQRQQEETERRFEDALKRGKKKR